MDIFVEAFGWVGMITIFAAYGWTMWAPCVSDKILFHALNLIGAIGLALNGFWNGAMPSAVLNVTWIVVAIIALRRVIPLSKENS